MQNGPPSSTCTTTMLPKKKCDPSPGNLRRAPKRRAVPCSSPPLKAWWSILHSTRNYKMQGAGFGYCRDPPVAPKALKMLYDGLSHGRRTGCTPLVWNRSKGTALNKNSEPGPRGT